MFTSPFATQATDTQPTTAAEVAQQSLASESAAKPQPDGDVFARLAKAVGDQNNDCSLADDADRAAAMRGWMASIKTLSPISSAVASGLLPSVRADDALATATEISTQLRDVINSDAAFASLTPSERGWLLNTLMSNSVDAVVEFYSGATPDHLSFNVDQWVALSVRASLHEASSQASALTYEMSCEEGLEATFMAASALVVSALDGVWSKATVKPNSFVRADVCREAMTLIVTVHEHIAKNIADTNSGLGRFGKQAAVREAGKIVASLIRSGAPASTSSHVKSLLPRAMQMSDSLLSMSRSLRESVFGDTDVLPVSKSQPEISNPIQDAFQEASKTPSEAPVASDVEVKTSNPVRVSKTIGSSDFGEPDFAFPSGTKSTTPVADTPSKPQPRTETKPADSGNSVNFGGFGNNLFGSPFGSEFGQVGA